MQKQAQKPLAGLGTGSRCTGAASEEAAEGLGRWSWLHCSLRSRGSVQAPRRLQGRAAPRWPPLCTLSTMPGAGFSHHILPHAGFPEQKPEETGNAGHASVQLVLATVTAFRQGPGF
jgi:hypothetical protein